MSRVDYRLVISFSLGLILSKAQQFILLIFNKLPSLCPTLLYNKRDDFIIPTIDTFISTIDYSSLLSSISLSIYCNFDSISDYFTLIGLNMFISSIFLRISIRDKLYLSSQFFRPFLMTDSDISFQFYPLLLQYREGSIPSAQHRHITPAMLTGFIN